MWKFSRCLSTILFTTTVAPAAYAQLKIGEPAPEVSLGKWIKGEPVSLADGKGSSVFLIEFWATWCPPCIELIPHNTELQRKYRDEGFVLLAISGPGRGETLSTVKRFVRKRGDAMGYTVAYDSEGTTHARYMGGIGAAGIPYAFLVDRQGRLVWHGHPGDPMMDEIIHDVIKGRYDVERAALQERLAPLFGRMQRMASIGDWEAFRKIAYEVLQLDPRNEAAIDAIMYAQLTVEQDAGGFRAFIERHIEANKDDPEAMHVLASMLLRIDQLDQRQPDLALRAARIAYDACEGGDCSKIDTYARAVFEIGMIDRAIELQTKAVAKADSDERRAELERVLDYFKICKTLQSKQL